MGLLYYGDNLDILQRYVADASVDLVYLDPPFNSAQTYNAFFQEKDGSAAASQIKAFEDTWHWNMEAAAMYDRLTEQPGKVGEAMQAFRTLLGTNDMMAYLVMMAPRLVELHRALKPTGSLYLHCDPTASHYLKLLLDAVFGREGFRNEIIWPRTNAHNIASGHFSRIHDTIFFYSRSADYVWNHAYAGFSPEQLSRYQREEETGRLYTGQDLTMTGSPQRNFEWRGTRPAPNRGWGLSLLELERLWDAGLILKRRDGSPRLDGRKVYLDEKKGKPVSDVWSDIERIGNTSAERLGYPTQKPIALLERIIAASSNPGDVVLDPFCGCGTTVDAAIRTLRRWIGIDITQLAITEIKARLQSTYGERNVRFIQDDREPGVEDTVYERASIVRVVGEPVSVPDAEVLAAHDKYQFQWWALGLVGARPVEQKKGADKGIDGKILFRESPNEPKPKAIIFSVKGGNSSVPHVRDLRGVIEREGAAIGVLITLHESTGPMKAEAAAAGFYESKVWGKKYPRLQLRTVGELLEGRAVERPPTKPLDETFKRAPKAKAAAEAHPELEL